MQTGVRGSANAVGNREVYPSLEPDLENFVAGCTRNRKAADGWFTEEAQKLARLASGKDANMHAKWLAISLIDRGKLFNLCC